MSCRLLVLQLLLAVPLDAMEVVRTGGCGRGDLWDWCWSAVLEAGVGGGGIFGLCNDGLLALSVEVGDIESITRESVA